jgi:FkbM family methyltransferase
MHFRRDGLPAVPSLRTAALSAKLEPQTGATKLQDQTPIDARADRANWRRRLKRYVVSHGIQAMCGATDVTAAAAMDVPLLSSGVRLAWLKALEAVGVKKFVARSAFGYDFVCHTGDLASFPFYMRSAYQAELELCAAWLKDEPHPVVFDIGANDGFIATQLAQMLAARGPKIYAFEPVPATFARLAQAIERLGLEDSVHPVPAAVVDAPGPVRLTYSDRNSLLAQITTNGLNPRVGDKLAQATGITLDAFCASSATFPQLLKIDAEGSEVAVLRGARELLSRADRPAILFEYNPLAWGETGATAGTLLDLLPGYSLHYINDLGGQRIPFGAPFEAEAIAWTCNLFAVPLRDSAVGRWTSLLQHSSKAGSFPKTGIHPGSSPEQAFSGSCSN